MTTRPLLLPAFAVFGAPLAWVAQLVLAYSFEEAACAPGDGHDVWGVGVRTLHVAVGAAAFAVAVASLVGALAVRSRRGREALPAADAGFVAGFAVAGALLFVFAIVLTGVGSTVLATCRQG